MGRGAISCDAGLLGVGRAPGGPCRGGPRAVRPASPRLSPAQPCKCSSSRCSLSGLCPESPTAWRPSLCPALHVRPRTFTARPGVETRGLLLTLLPTPPSLQSRSAIPGRVRLLLPPEVFARPGTAQESGRDWPCRDCGWMDDGWTWGGAPELAPVAASGFPGQGKCVFTILTNCPIAPQNVTVILFSFSPSALGAPGPLHPH